MCVCVCVYDAMGCPRGLAIHTHTHIHDCMRKYLHVYVCVQEDVKLKTEMCEKKLPSDLEAKEKRLEQVRQRRSV